MQVLSVLAGQARPTAAKSGLTGHFKQPVGSATITAQGLAGDTIVDRAHHGGPDQAIYVFGEYDRDVWAQTLGHDLPFGYFGENLAISDLSSSDTAIGDCFKTGEVLLEVTSPRIPCATFAAHVGQPTAIKTFYDLARPGVYCRVLREGVVTDGDAVTCTPYQGDRITMDVLLQQTLTKYDDAGLVRRLRDVPAHHKMHEMARQRLGQT